MRYLPNTDHSVVSPDTFSNLLAWYHAVLQNSPRPRFTWHYDSQGSTIAVRVLDAPSSVKLWSATNPSARDFRLETIGPAWTSTDLQGANGVYTATVPMPSSGWTAYFVELTYPAVSGFPLVFTTEVKVIPGWYPYSTPMAFPSTAPRQPPPR